MSNSVQSKVCKCSNCQMKTLHNRNAHVMGGGMVIIHLAAIVITAGFWLAYLIPATMIRSLMTGRWVCSRCGK